MFRGRGLSFGSFGIAVNAGKFLAFAVTLLLALLHTSPPADAQSGEVTNVQMSIYNRTSIDVSWENTDQNVKHYIRWRSEYRDATRNILTDAWEAPGGSDGVERGAGVRTYRISGVAGNMYQVQIRRDGGQWMAYRAYVPLPNDRTDPPHSVKVAPGDQRLQVSWLPSRGPTPTKYVIDWDWTHEGTSYNPPTSEAEIEGRELGTNVRHRYTITGIPNGATANVSVKAVLTDWGEDYESREERVTGVSPMEPPEKSNDATLDDILIWGVGRVYRYSPDFDSATTQYAVTVPRDVEHVIPIAYVNEVNATYEVPAAVGYNHPSGLHRRAVILAAPAVPKDIDIVVTAHDGVTTKTYTVTATRQGFTDATLKALTVSDGANNVPLTPAFDSDTVSYTASVEHGVSSVTVTPTVNESHATVTVDGTAVDSGTESSAVSLTAGEANDIEVVVSAEDTSVTKTYTVSVTRAGSSDATLSGLTISDGTLTPAFDSSKTAYTATVANSVASVTVTPTVNESNAAVAVNGSAVTSGSPSQAISLTAGQSTDVNVVVTAQDGVTTRTYTIAVTRAPPTFSITATASATEGSAASLTITLSENAPTGGVAFSVTPQYSTTGTGNAVAADVGTVTTPVTVAEDTSTKSISIPTAEDKLDEDAETFKVVIATSVSPWVKAGDGKDTATITINDDDTAGFTVTPTTLNINEGASKTYTIVLDTKPTASVAVSLSNPDSGAVTVSPTSWTFTTTNWNTAKTFTVSGVEENSDYDDETVTISHSATSGDTKYSGLTPDSVTVNVGDNDVRPVTVAFGASTYSVDETDDTTTTMVKENEATVTVSLSADPERTVTIPITKANQGGATSSDYSGVPANVVFTSGDTSKTFTFSATSDTVDDDGESVKLTFGTLPAGVSAGSTDETTVSITDDDVPSVTVSFGAATYSVDETDETTTTMVKENEATVTVTLSADPERTVTIPITKANQGGATSADYSGVPASVAFNSGETSKSFTFAATADTVDDDGESVKLTFGTLPAGVSAGSVDETTISITDDDLPADVDVSFEQSSYTVAEGSSVSVKVKLSVAPERSITIPITKSNQGGATSADYSGVPASLTFGATDTEKSITFAATSDNLDDDGESVDLGFGTLPTGVTVGTTSTTAVSITDDDLPSVTVSFGESTYSVDESDDTTTMDVDESQATVTVTLSADPERTVTIPITKTNQGGATSSDYSGVPASVVFNSGDTSKTFTFSATADTIDDDGESVKLTFGTLPTGVSAGSTDEATVTINDDDVPAVTAAFEQSAFTVAEGSNGTVKVTLSADPERTVTIPITKTNQGGATSSDYSGVPASVVFNSGDTSKTFTFTATADTIDDDGESVKLAFGTLPTGITAGSPSSVQVTIRDDDATVPSAVTGLRVEPGYSRLLLSWTAPTGEVTGYEVHYTLSPTVAADEPIDDSLYGLYPNDHWAREPRHPGTEPTETIYERPPKLHRVRVRAVNDHGPGPWVTGSGTPMPSPVTVSLSASPNPLVEGGSVTLTATLKIGELPTFLQHDVFIPLRVTRRTSEAGDHGAVHGITIKKLQRSASVVIPTYRDGDGDDEFFTVTVGPRPTPPVRVDDRVELVQVRIAEREPPRVSLEASPNPVHEGNTVTVTARLSQAMSTDLTLSVTVTRIDSEGGDHDGLSSITVPRGRTTGTGTIATHEDEDTDDERFTVALGSVPLPAAAVSPTSVEVTIADLTEPEPVVPSDTHGLLSVSPSPAQEGKTVTLTATLEEPAPSGGIAVQFYTADGDTNSASADDYTLSPSAGQGGSVFQDWTPEIRIPAGQRTATATLSIAADGIAEGDETLTVQLFVSFRDRDVGYIVPVTIQDAAVSSSTQQNDPCDNCGTGGDTGAVSQAQAQYAGLIARMKEWRNDPEWVSEKAHTDRWDRALLAFGETVEDATLTPMTAAEAQGFADKGWERWVEVAAALRVLQNRAPTVSSAIADVTIVSDSGSHAVSLAGVFDDPDGDSLTVSAASSDEATATASVSSDNSSLTVTARLKGAATITVTAADSYGGSASETFTVTVKAAPLVASAIADLSGLETGATQDVSLSGVFSDADGDALTTSAASSDETKATVTVASGGASLTLTGVAEGTATVTVTAQDSDGNRVSDSFQVEVSAGGQYADLIARMYQWRNDPQWVGEKPHTDRWDRALLALGETVADTTLTAMTAAEAQGFADRGWERWVEVATALREIESGGQPEPTNQAPTVSAAISDATIVNESRSHQVSLSGVFSDADNDALTVTAASSEEAKATVSVATDYSSLTVSAQGRGTATITVTANDGKGGAVSETFTVTVKAAPDVASDIADVSGLEAGSTRDVSLSGVFSDADGDALTVSASSDDEAIATVAVAADHSALTVAGVAEGTATITVIAQDSDGNLVMDDFDVSVVAQQQQVTPNQAPTVSAAISDVTIVKESGTMQVSLSGVFSDADNDALSITAASSDEAKATVSVAADGSSLTVNAQALGTTTIMVTANDGNGGTVEDRFTVTIKAAPAVASAIGDISGMEVEDTRDMSLSGVFSDADGDALTFTAGTSDSAVADAILFQGTLTVIAVADGTATVTVTAQDADGNTVSDSFDVTVVGPPSPVTNLSCIASTGQVLFQWDVPEWSGAELYAYDYDLALPDGKRGQTRLSGYPLVRERGDYQVGKEASISIKAVYELADGSEVYSEAVALTCTVAE